MKEEEKSAFSRGFAFGIFTVLVLLFALSFFFQVPVKIVCDYDDEVVSYYGIQSFWDFFAGSNVVYRVQTIGQEGNGYFDKAEFPQDKCVSGR